jgi:hypothetical protein
LNFNSDKQNITFGDVEDQGKTGILQPGNQEITWQSGIGNKTRKWSRNFLEAGQDPSNQPAKNTDGQKPLKIYIGNF